MSHSLLLRPENRCRGGSEPLPALHALRSEAFAEDLSEPVATPRARAGNGTIASPWWKRVFDAQVFKSRGVDGLAAGHRLGGGAA